MKPKGLEIFLIFLLIIQAFLMHNLQANAASQAIGAPEVYVGVDVGYENLTATKQIADEISPYANFFIIGCSDVTYNLTQLNDLCQYLYDRNFYFMAYRMTAPNNTFLEALRKWGDRFLGFYAYDELGGRQLDQAQDYITVTQADNYADASTKYVNTLNGWLRNGRLNFTRNFAYPTEFPLVTSDYALYWYDYRAGYDTIFAEFGWNYSRQINVALNRGAATAQNKDWGVMITHTYTTPPYLESGQELYQDMVYAYQNGAKYIIIFDSNPQWTQGTLKQEHLDAMKQFWQYAQNNPRNNVSTSSKVAYVLPADYAYGFRGPTDKIWGLWEADSIAEDLSMGVGYLLKVYGENLDIIYEDALSSAYSNGYHALIYWNDSRLFQPEYPNLSPIPTQTPTPTPSTNPSPTQTNPIPSPSPTLPPSPSPSPSPSPTTQHTPTPGPEKSFLIPMEYVGFITVGFLAAAAMALTLRFKKRRIEK
jgi:hypothetical protein